MTRKKPTKRRAKRKMDDLKEDVDADDTDVTVTITSVDVPPASDDTDDGDDVDGPTPDDAVVTHARTSTDPDVPNFRVDPDDVRDRLADDPPADPTHDWPAAPISPRGVTPTK